MKKLLKLFLLLVVVSCTEDPILYTLTTSSNPPEGGTLTPETSQFEEGETVLLNATPSEEYTFSIGWELRDQELQQVLLWTLTKLSQLFLQKNVTH